MNETQKLIGVDGLVEFGQYLNTLYEVQHRSYTFEMPDSGGELAECSLNDVIERFQGFFDAKTDSFRVLITYLDYQLGILGSVDREFKRNRK